MSYTFTPGRMYRMPTHFGPSLGPRQGPDGRRFACKAGPQTTAYYVRFLGRRDQLEKLMPDCFELDGEPVVTVEYAYMTEIEWLAGRGYAVLGVSFPVAFNGARDHVRGSFLTVLWENLADPIFIGREELGFSKIYCELPPPMVVDGQTHCIASWLDFKFMDMRIRDLKQVSPDAAGAADAGDGILHYRYLPRTGEWGTADVSCPVLTPAAHPNRVVKEMWAGDGTVEFHGATWNDLPTTYHIVNAFHQLDIVEYRGASMVKSVGAKDLSDQRMLE